MRRIILTSLSVLVLFSVLLDPYTFRRTASDYVEWAPGWQMLLGITDLVLLVALVALVGHGSFLRASQLLMAETLYSLTVASVLLQRDGLARFVHGIGAEQYLTLYLAALGLRVVLIVAMMRTPRVPGSSTCENSAVNRTSSETQPTTR